MEKRGLFLTNRHVSWMLSFFIVTSFFVFIAGYFFGKKKAVEKFYKKIDQDSLADHIYYSVCSIYDNGDAIARQESTEVSTDGSRDAFSLAKGEVRKTEKKKTESVVKVTQAINVQQAKVESVQVENNKTPQENYYAELIGFGTARAANRFVKKLEKQGFSVVLKRRKSRSSKGKTIVWYQVITEKFDNKSDLIAFVDIIKDKERLKGIRIVQC